MEQVLDRCFSPWDNFMFHAQGWSPKNLLTFIPGDEIKKVVYNEV